MSLFDHFFAARDRWLSNARFRRFAAAFPLTRPLARHHARALFDVCAGFVYSQTLLACVRLRLFEHLSQHGPQSPAELASRFALSEEAMLRLLRAAASLKLVQARSGGRYGLGRLGAAMIDNQGIMAMVEHHALLYHDLRDPLALLRGEQEQTGLGQYWPYATTDQPSSLQAEKIAAYTELMAASQPMVAQEVLNVYSFKRHRCLLDVGGGDGTFLRAVAAQAPQLRLMLFDLPAVAQQAKARFNDAGLAERVQVFGGSALSDTLPQGADIISLVRVIHDHEDEVALAFLRAARAALPDDGVLLLAEPMAGTSGAEPISDAYFGFYLLAMGTGRARTPTELQALLIAAGFERFRILATHTPLLTRVMLAHPAR